MTPLRAAAALLLLGISTSACDWPRAYDAAGERLAAGRTLITQGHYEESLPILRDCLERWPDGEHASRASYLIGKALLGLGRHDAAREAWERTRDAFPATLEGHKARYKLAVLMMLAGEREAARAAFADLADHPEGPLAPEAHAMAAFLNP